MCQIVKRMIPVFWKNRLKSFFGSFGAKGESYSQSGEDMILRFLFQDKLGHLKISYLDAGANLPHADNNTYLFYRHGGHGCLVEANPFLISDLRAVRPNDIILHAGLTQGSVKDLTFYVFQNSGISTFDEKTASERAKITNSRPKEMVVPCININEILEKYFPHSLDLLSIDIEDMDYSVLESINFSRFKIHVIIAETCIFNSHGIDKQEKSIVDLLEQRGYERYANTHLNTIFVSKNWFYKT